IRAPGSYVTRVAIATFHGAPGTTVRLKTSGVIPGTSTVGRGGSGAGAFCPLAQTFPRRINPATVISRIALILAPIAVLQIASIPAFCEPQKTHAQLELLQPQRSECAHRLASEARCCCDARP